MESSVRMIPQQSFWPIGSYDLPTGNHTHHCRQCVVKHFIAVLNIPNTIYKGLGYKIPSLGNLLWLVHEHTSPWISNSDSWTDVLAPRQTSVHPPSGTPRLPSLAHQSIPKNRPFINLSRGRSIRQGSWSGDKHKEIITCH